MKQAATLGIFKPGQDRYDWIDRDLYMNFTNEVNWYYLISVARGRRTYCYSDSIFRTDKESVDFEISLSDTIENYDSVIETFRLLEQLPRFNESSDFHEDFRRLVTTKAWFEQAYKRMPKGTVVLKCGPTMWKASRSGAKKWNKPDKLYWDFFRLGEQCQKAIDSKADLEKFADAHAYYENYSSKQISEIFGEAEIVKD